jgi:hypothetical protein
MVMGHTSQSVKQSVRLRHPPISTHQFSASDTMASAPELTFPRVLLVRVFADCVNIKPRLA